MIETEAKAEYFKLRTPLLSKGRQDTELTRTDTMRVWMKCYAEGGENVLHAHPSEDHIFVILQGQARFHDKDDTERVLGRNDGIMLPAGSFYYFESCGDEPLVCCASARTPSRRRLRGSAWTATSSWATRPRTSTRRRWRSRAPSTSRTLSSIWLW